MSLKVCTSAQSWSSWKLLVPLPPGPALQTDGEVFWWNTNSCNHWIRYRSEDESKGQHQSTAACRDWAEGRALPWREGSNPVSSSPDSSRRELARFWQCRWESGKEQRLQGKQHEKGWSSAHFHPKDPHNLPACKRGNSTEVCSCSWGDFWQKNGRPALLHSAEQIHNL